MKWISGLGRFDLWKKNRGRKSLYSPFRREPNNCFWPIFNSGEILPLEFWNNKKKSAGQPLAVMMYYHDFVVEHFGRDLIGKETRHFPPFHDTVFSSWNRAFYTYIVYCLLVHNLSDLTYFLCLYTSTLVRGVLNICLFLLTVFFRWSFYVFTRPFCLLMLVFLSLPYCCLPVSCPVRHL
jgi:hypothetical protein